MREEKSSLGGAEAFLIGCPRQTGTREVRRPFLRDVWCFLRGRANGAPRRRVV
jgi:hypothetical protein